MERNRSQKGTPNAPIVKPLTKWERNRSILTLFFKYFFSKFQIFLIHIMQQPTYLFTRWLVQEGGYHARQHYHYHPSHLANEVLHHLFAGVIISRHLSHGERAP